MSARIEDVLAEHRSDLRYTDRFWRCPCGHSLGVLSSKMSSLHRSHVAEMLQQAGFGDVAQARKDALLEAADDLVAFAEDMYSPVLFRRPSSDDYAEVNALLQRERGHMLDGIAADCYQRAINVQAGRLREMAAEDSPAPASTGDGGARPEAGGEASSPGAGGAS